MSMLRYLLSSARLLVCSFVRASPPLLYLRQRFDTSISPPDFQPRSPRASVVEEGRQHARLSGLNVPDLFLGDGAWETRRIDTRSMIDDR